MKKYKFLSHGVSTCSNFFFRNIVSSKTRSFVNCQNYLLFHSVKVDIFSHQGKTGDVSDARMSKSCRYIPSDSKKQIYFIPLNIEINIKQYFGCRKIFLVESSRSRLYF